VPSKVSPSDAYSYLSLAQRDGVINKFERIRHKGRVYFAVEVPSTHYDHYHGIEWVELVFTSREVCAFIEGVWAAQGKHPVSRAGAYRATWEEGHVSPHPLRG